MRPLSYDTEFLCSCLELYGCCFRTLGFHNSGNNTDACDGNTCENVDVVLVESADGIDGDRNSLADVGAIYPTTTKVKTVLTSTDTLADICKAVPIPVNAIGGLNKNNIDVLAGIPIAGICVVSAIMKAESPKIATIELKARAKELGII